METRTTDRPNESGEVSGIVKAHWWNHVVCAVKSEDGKLYGIQATHFCMNHCQTQFYHIALTDVAEGKHHRAELREWSPDAAPWTKGVQFFIDGRLVSLRFEPFNMQEYPSQTSEHTGCPRFNVEGFINTPDEHRIVSGVGCYDREVFDKLLLPGETGWNWTILWYDDGEWDMQYRFRIGHSTEHYRIQIPTKDPRTPNIMVNCPVEGIWPKGEHTPVYYEHFILLKDEERKQIGTGFSEFTLIDL